MAQALYRLSYPDPHVAGSYVSQYWSHNGRQQTADRNELLKMYFVYLGTLYQWRINQTENRTSRVFNVSDNITDISDIEIFPLKNKYTAVGSFFNSGVTGQLTLWCNCFKTLLISPNIHVYPEDGTVGSE